MRPASEVSASTLVCGRLFSTCKRHALHRDATELLDRERVLHDLPGNSDCVQLLIATGACLEAYDLYYGTPLHVACANQHTNCVKELLNAGELSIDVSDGRRCQVTLCVGR